MNVEPNLLPAGGDTAYRAAEQVASLNRNFLEKLVSYQLEIATGMLDRGLTQVKRLSEAKTFDEVFTAHRAYVEEATQRGLESTQKVIEIMNESGQAYKVLYQDNRTSENAAAPAASVKATSTAPKRAARKTAPAKPVAAPKSAKPTRGRPRKTA